MLRTMIGHCEERGESQVSSVYAASRRRWRRQAQRQRRLRARHLMPRVRRARRLQEREKRPVLFTVRVVTYSRRGVVRHVAPSFTRLLRQRANILQSVMSASMRASFADMFTLCRVARLAADTALRRVAAMLEARTSAVCRYAFAMLPAMRQRVRSERGRCHAAPSLCGGVTARAVACRTPSSPYAATATPRAAATPCRSSVLRVRRYARSGAPYVLRHDAARFTPVAFTRRAVKGEARCRQGAIRREARVRARRAVLPALAAQRAPKWRMCRRAGARRCREMRRKGGGSALRQARWRASSRRGLQRRRERLPPVAAMPPLFTPAM